MQAERTRTAGRTIPPAQLDTDVLTRIARGGLLISEAELSYQLARRGHDLATLPGLLAGLEDRGLIESAVHYRLTPAGAQLLPTAERPAPAGMSSIPWTVVPAPARSLSARARRPSARTTRRPAARAGRAARRVATESTP
jgi:hypothetical protein